MDTNAHTPEAINHYLQMSPIEARINAATATDTDILSALAFHSAETVRKAVAQNSHTATSTLERLALDTSNTIRFTVAQHANVTAVALRRLVTPVTDGATLYEVAAHPATDQQTIDLLKTSYGKNQAVQQGLNAAGRLKDDPADEDGHTGVTNVEPVTVKQQEETIETFAAFVKTLAEKRIQNHIENNLITAAITPELKTKMLPKHPTTLNGVWVQTLFAASDDVDPDLIAATLIDDQQHPLVHLTALHNPNLPEWAKTLFALAGDGGYTELMFNTAERFSRYYGETDPATLYQLPGWIYDYVENYDWS